MPLPFLRPGDEHPPGYRVVKNDDATPPYAVEHVRTGSRCTLLLFPALPWRWPGEAERFVASVHAGERVRSNHIARVLDVGVTEDVPWTLLEALPGRDLGELMKWRGTLDLGTATAILRAVGDVLGKAHEVGMTDSGLEAGVIFVGAAPGEPLAVKVTGLGLARYRIKQGAEAPLYPYRSTQFAYWLAPEQIEGPGTSATSHVWTLGLLGFWMLTAKPFWKSNAGFAQAYEAVAEPLPTASERARELGVEALLPLGFPAWFARCVNRDPEARFTNGEEAADALFGPEPRCSPLRQP